MPTSSQLRVARPRQRSGLGLFGLLINSRTQGEDCSVFASVSLCWGDEADAAVSVLGVVPSHEPGNPLARFIEEAVRTYFLESTVAKVGDNLPTVMIVSRSLINDAPGFNLGMVEIVRIISARRAESKERIRYEQNRSL